MYRRYYLTPFEENTFSAENFYFSDCISLYPTCFKKAVEFSGVFNIGRLLYELAVKRSKRLQECQEF